MTKERLRRYAEIKRERQQIERRLEEVETALYSPKAQLLTGMPSSGSHDNERQAELLDKKKQLLSKLTEKKIQLAAEELEIETAIESLPDPTMRRLMRYHYIDGLVWEAVCTEISYSWRQTHRLHAAALKILEKEEIKCQTACHL